MDPKIHFISGRTREELIEVSSPPVIRKNVKTRRIHFGSTFLQAYIQGLRLKEAEKKSCTI